MTHINHLNQNLFVHVKPPKTSKASFAWNYFGHLHKKPNELLDVDRIYCKVCFDKVKDEHPEVNFSIHQKQTGAYNITSGTGNMKNHLLAVHRISEPEHTKTTNQHILSMFSRDRAARSLHLKQQLAHHLTLMCCKVLPFSIVENEGLYYLKA